MERWQGGQGSYRAGSFDQNEGVRGVVYILANEGFRDGFYKIGCSRHSGATRAREQNAQASTAIPAMYRCVYELEAADCGGAERLAHRKLQAARRGKHGVDRSGRGWGQEFFEVDLETAIEAVKDACKQTEQAISERRQLKAVQATRFAQDGARILGPVGRTGGSGERGLALYSVGPAATWPSAADNALSGATSRSTKTVLGWLMVVVVLVWLLYGRRGEVQRHPQPAVAHVPVQVARVRDAPRPAVLQPPAAAAVGSVAAEAQEKAVAREMPAPSTQGVRPFPPSGSVTYRFAKVDDAKRAITLKLSTPSSKVYRFAVLVVAVPMERVYAVAYLGPDDLAEVSLPAGRFRLVYTSGVEWLGEGLLFGPGRKLKSLGGEFDATGGATVRAELPLE